jgi:hypothetical protein
MKRQLILILGINLGVVASLAYWPCYKPFSKVCVPGGDDCEPVTGEPGVESRRFINDGCNVQDAEEVNFWELGIHYQNHPNSSFCNDEMKVYDFSQPNCQNWTGTLNTITIKGVCPGASVSGLCGS